MTDLIYKVPINDWMRDTISAYLKDHPLHYRDMIPSIIERADKCNENAIGLMINGAIGQFQYVRSSESYNEADFESAPFVGFPKEYLILNHKLKYGLLNLYPMRADIYKFIYRNSQLVRNVRYVKHGQLYMSSFGQDNFIKCDISSLVDDMKIIRARQKNLGEVVRANIITAIGGFVAYD